MPEAVLDLLSEYHQQGYEVWLELGLQTAHDKTLHSRTASGTQSGRVPTQRPTIFASLTAWRYIERSTFQAYTSTFAEVQVLRSMYRQAVSEANIVGLCVGTPQRPTIFASLTAWRYIERSTCTSAKVLV
jgi:radical SAM superfamily enzyme